MKTVEGEKKCSQILDLGVIKSQGVGRATYYVEQLLTIWLSFRLSFNLCHIYPNGGLAKKVMNDVLLNFCLISRFF
jgi:hypothetical protein